MCSTKEDSWTTYSSPCGTSLPEEPEPQPPSAIEKQAVSAPAIKVSETHREGGKLVTSGTKRKVSVPPKSLYVQSRFISLKAAQEEPDVLLNKRCWGGLPGLVQPSDCPPTRPVLPCGHQRYCWGNLESIT